ncbi:histidine phosphatase family protein [Marivita hallyeonensis]|uniref:Probable phosphoglycerate mutase n=1 Tax=Marivita hallyeonensis TaxID=996342 RepID=A0A1M5XJQ8_9RHOB|nr:histidine phosphatase family protein [Marivita hallyeonensis]SHI00041.1 probable phosphoglycerate mutase [Marivita hallyeonensis]
MRLLLVRHGQSEWNAVHRLQGQADIGLSELGKAQADTLRPVIERIGPCRTVASDLKRVRETAARIGAEAPRHTMGLREIDVGDWTGRPIEEIVAEDEAAYLGWRAGTVAPPRGEAWGDFVFRVSGIIEQERAKPCENLLVVCHGGVIRALLQKYIGLEPAHIIPVAPASLSAFRLGNGKPPRLELFNYRPTDLDFGAPD